MLGEFWSNLSAYDQKLWYATEVYQRNKLQIKTITDESLEILRTEASNKSVVINGSCNFEILNNIIYADKLQYQSLDLRYNELDHELCDMISRVIYYSPHNQTEKVDDIMKVIGDKMNTNLMVRKLKEKSGNDIIEHMKN